MSTLYVLGTVISSGDIEIQSPSSLKKLTFFESRRPCCDNICGRRMLTGPCEPSGGTPSPLGESRYRFLSRLDDSWKRWEQRMFQKGGTSCALSTFCFVFLCLCKSDPHCYFSTPSAFKVLESRDCVLFITFLSPIHTLFKA